MPPKTLKLEITESVMMTNPEDAVKMLGQIKELDVQLAIDDFGTGYSSLSYLNRFPLDTLKIDRCFTKELGTKNGGREIIKTIMPMASDLRLNVIAEWVENSDK